MHACCRHASLPFFLIHFFFDQAMEDELENSRKLCVAVSEQNDTLVGALGRLERELSLALSERDLVSAVSSRSIFLLQPFLFEKSAAINQSMEASHGNALLSEALCDFDEQAEHHLVHIDK